MGSMVASGELSLLQPDSFDNQISGQRIILMDCMARNLKRREGIRKQRRPIKDTEKGENNERWINSE